MATDSVAVSAPEDELSLGSVPDLIPEDSLNPIDVAEREVH